MLKIFKITIVRIKNHTDKIYLNTNLPSGVYPFKGNCYLTFEVAEGTGIEYCKKNFSEINYDNITVII